MCKEELNNKIANLLEPDRVDPIFDYEDWSILMPLVVEHGISLSYLRDGRACAYQYIRGGNEDRPSTQAQHKNPQRALAETVLLVLQDKENKE